jgi:actin related protein 2/3 complex subunit 2
MILLEFHNRVIAECLRSRYASFAATGDAAKIKEVDVTVADFDGVKYHISNPTPEDKSKIMVSISLQYYYQLQESGVEDFLKAEYTSFYTPEAEAGYDASLVIDVAATAGEADKTIDAISKFKRNCFAAVFKKFFEIQKSGGAGIDGAPACVQYRPQETMYISAHKDRVTVVFSTLFSDDDDIVLGKVFLQEFREGRKGNPSSPQVLFSHKEPPSEVANMPGALTGDNVGYITFVLFPRHLDAKNCENTIDLIHQFRDYLHYHLKCCKAYLHTRMRARSAALLKILNRAKPENENKQRKTISGRSFVRK